MERSQAPVVGMLKALSVIQRELSDPLAEIHVRDCAVAAAGWFAGDPGSLAEWAVLVLWLEFAPIPGVEVQLPRSAQCRFHLMRRRSYRKYS